MAEIDPRIVRVGIEVDGVAKVYEGLNITATGTKFANANQNECEVKITNLSKATRDYILSETSPFNANRTPKRLFVEAGRVSYGATRLFQGEITAATPSQPPDITITLKALTGNYAKGDIVARTGGLSTPLSVLSHRVADDLGLALQFEAREKMIANYAFSGAKIKQVDALGGAGGVSAFVDDGVLIVKERAAPLAGRLRVLNVDSGLIGIPEVTERGIKVRFLLDNRTVLGGALRLESVIYPAVNGEYTIYKLGFQVASRDTPFYWIAEASRNG